MTVTIRLQHSKARRGSPRSRCPTPGVSDQSGAADRKGAGRPKSAVEKALFVLFLSLPFVTLIQTVLARTSSYAEYSVTRHLPLETVIVGPRWAFTVPFAVKNKADIERLIECESGGLNVSGPDSDGIISDGILQFHRGPGDTLARSTWQDFSRESGITGSPRDPADAIRMADWAISHGLGPRWTCWQLLGLSPGS